MTPIIKASRKDDENATGNRNSSDEEPPYPYADSLGFSWLRTFLSGR
jgi:hypothetical protein